MEGWPTIRELFVNAVAFERSRSHGRRYACLLVEAFFDPFAFRDVEGVISLDDAPHLDAHDRAQ